MQINLGRFDVLVAEQFLNRSNISTRLQQMGGKRMPKSVGCNLFMNPCQSDDTFENIINRPLIEMMSTSCTAAWIFGVMISGKYILPFNVVLVLSEAKPTGARNRNRLLRESLLAFIIEDGVPGKNRVVNASSSFFSITSTSTATLSTSTYFAHALFKAHQHSAIKSQQDCVLKHPVY